LTNHLGFATAEEGDSDPSHAFGGRPPNWVEPSPRLTAGQWAQHAYLLSVKADVAREAAQKAAEEALAKAAIAQNHCTHAQIAQASAQQAAKAQIAQARGWHVEPMAIPDDKGFGDSIGDHSGEDTTDEFAPKEDDEANSESGAPAPPPPPPPPPPPEVVDTAPPPPPPPPQPQTEQQPPPPPPPPPPQKNASGFSLLPLTILGCQSKFRQKVSGKQPFAKRRTVFSDGGTFLVDIPRWRVVRAVA